MKRMKYGLVILLMVCIQSAGFAQPGVAPVKKIDGKKYYVHTIESGNTLWGISRTYSVSVNDIKAANPSLGNTLQIGKEVLVPMAAVDQKEAKNPPVMEGDNLIHTVARGETLYGIAQRYKLAISDITEANPSAASGALQIGQKLKIPSKEVAGNPDAIKPAIEPDTPVDNGNDLKFIKHTVKAGETLYGIAKQYKTSVDTLTALNKVVISQGMKVGDVLVIPPVIENNMVETPVDVNPLPGDSTKPLLNRPTMRAEVYKVAVILPFFVYKNKKIQENPDPRKPKDIYGKSLNTLDFYGGVLSAVDSLKSQGVSVELFVYDTNGDSASVAKILQKPEMKTVQLIIGPFYTKNISQVTEFGKTHNIHTVTPVSQSSKKLLDTPGLSKATSSSSTQVDYLAGFIAEKYGNENVVMVRSKDEKDRFLEDIFEHRFNAEIGKNKNAYRDSLSIGKAGNHDIKTLAANKFKADKLNIIVLPSDDRAFVSHFFTMIAALRPRIYGDYRFMIFGLEDWKGYHGIDVDSRQRFNLHLTSPYYCDYDAQETIDFYRYYRSKNKGLDPGEMSLLGFDITYYYLLGLQTYGTGFFQQFPDVNFDPMLTDFRLKQQKQTDGFENNVVYILKYEDYQLKKVN